MTDSVVDRRPESVLVLVYTSSKEVLLIQRTDSPDFWQSITGGLEFDELPATTADRELFEETGFRADELSTSIVNHHTSTSFEISGVWRKRYRPEYTHNREHLFSFQLSKKINPVLNPKEHSAFVWLPAEQAILQASSPTNKRAIDSIVFDRLP